jgi:hypothetical protein
MEDELDALEELLASERIKRMKIQRELDELKAVRRE